MALSITPNHILNIFSSSHSLSNNFSQNIKMFWLKKFYSSITGINIFFMISSLGKNGARSSNGGLTSVPSSKRFVALFGSKFCSAETNTSQKTVPSIFQCLIYHILHLGIGMSFQISISKRLR